MELRPATLLKTGLWIVGIGWAPVVVVGFIDPATHPAGLAVIAWAATMSGLGLVAAGCVTWLAQRLGRKRRRRS
jgi:hypothetical protein